MNSCGRCWKKSPQLSCKLPCLKVDLLQKAMGSWQSSGVWGSFGLCGANKWLCLIIGMWIINSGGLTCTPDCLSSYLFSKWKHVGLVLWLKAN